MHNEQEFRQTTKQDTKSEDPDQEPRGSRPLIETIENAELKAKKRREGEGGLDSLLCACCSSTYIYQFVLQMACGTHIGQIRKLASSSWRCIRISQRFFLENSWVYLLLDGIVESRDD
jgi:hypothetical protein